jgi:hypothetical protein
VLRHVWRLLQGVSRIQRKVKSLSIMLSNYSSYRVAFLWKFISMHVNFRCLILTIIYLYFGYVYRKKVDGP